MKTVSFYSQLNDQTIMAKVVGEFAKKRKRTGIKQDDPELLSQLEEIQKSVQVANSFSEAVASVRNVGWTTKFAGDNTLLSWYMEYLRTKADEIQYLPTRNHLANYAKRGGHLLINRANTRSKDPLLAIQYSEAYFKGFKNYLKEHEKINKATTLKNHCQKVVSCLIWLKTKKGIDVSTAGLEARSEVANRPSLHPDFVAEFLKGNKNYEDRFKQAVYLYAKASIYCCLRSSEGLNITPNHVGADTISIIRTKGRLKVSEKPVPASFAQELRAFMAGHEKAPKTVREKLAAKKKRNKIENAVLNGGIIPPTWLLNVKGVPKLPPNVNRYMNRMLQEIFSEYPECQKPFTIIWTDVETGEVRQDTKPLYKHLHLHDMRRSSVNYMAQYLSIPELEEFGGYEKGSKALQTSYVRTFNTNDKVRAAIGH